MIRILIIDDQKLVLHSLEGLIELEEKLKVVGKAENPEQGIELVEQLQPDVAIVDLAMPSKSGLEITYLITQNYPKTKVIIFTGSDGRMLNKAILAGAKGYLLKSTSIEDLVAAIYAVERNSIYIGRGILDRVQLSSIDSQRFKINQINFWLAKEVIDWWRKYSTPTPVAKQIIEDLGLERLELSWIKDDLCLQNDTSLTLTEELKLKVEEFFVQIKESADPYRELAIRKPRIRNWLYERSKSNPDIDYSTILYNNCQSLQRSISQKLQQLISSWQQAAPLPLLNCLQSVEEHLLDRQQFLKQEYESNLIKENSAWHSFDYLVVAPEKSLLNKQELCKKVVLFIYRCKMDAELNKLLSQVIIKIIQQLKVQLDILSKTDNLLLESIEQLAQKNTSEVTTLTPPFKQIQPKVRPEVLRRHFEEILGHSLNQWGIAQSISSSEINNRLLEKLRPIAQKIHSHLRKEALAVSFLEYAEYRDPKVSIENNSSEINP